MSGKHYHDHFKLFHSSVRLSFTSYIKVKSPVISVCKIIKIYYDLVMTAIFEELPIESDASRSSVIAELEKDGPGGIYAVNGAQLEPVAMYAGGGLFKGLYLEVRPGVRSLRVGFEEVKGLDLGQTLLVHSKIETKPVDLEDRVTFITEITQQIIKYYMDPENGADVYSDEFRKHKLGLFKEFIDKLNKKEIVITDSGSVNF